MPTRVDFYNPAPKYARSTSACVNRNYSEHQTQSIITTQTSTGGGKDKIRTILFTDKPPTSRKIHLMLVNYFKQFITGKSSQLLKIEQKWWFYPVPVLEMWAARWKQISKSLRPSTSEPWLPSPAPAHIVISCIMYGLRVHKPLFYFQVNFCGRKKKYEVK